MPTLEELLSSRRSSSGGGGVHGGDDGSTNPPKIAADGIKKLEKNSFLDAADDGGNMAAIKKTEKTKADEGRARNVSPTNATTAGGKSVAKTASSQSTAGGKSNGRRVGGTMRSSAPLGLSQLGGLGVVSIGIGGGRKRRSVPPAAAAATGASASVAAASASAPKSPKAAAAVAITVAAATKAARRTSLLSAEARLRRIGISDGIITSADGMSAGGMAGGTSGIGGIGMHRMFPTAPFSSPLATAAGCGYGYGEEGGEAEGKEAHDGSASGGGRIISIGIGAGGSMVGANNKPSHSNHRTIFDEVTMSEEDVAMGGNNMTTGTTEVARDGKDKGTDGGFNPTAGKPKTTDKSTVQNVPASTSADKNYNSYNNIDDVGVRKVGNVGGGTANIPPPPSLISPTVPAGKDNAPSPSFAKMTNEKFNESNKSTVVIPPAKSSGNNGPNVHANAVSASKITKSNSDSSNRSSTDRMAALIDVLERSGRLVPMDVEEEDGEEGVVKAEYGGTTMAAVTPKVGTITAAANGGTHTPYDGRGLAYVSAHSSSGDASFGQGSSSHSSTYTYGNSPMYAPPLESYQHLLLDRFLPPLDVSTPNLTTSTTTGTWPTDMTDPFSADTGECSGVGGGGAGVVKKRARGGRGKRTKKVARKRPGRGKSGDDIDGISSLVPAQATTGRGKRKSSKGPARSDGRPPSLTTYLAGLNEAKLKKAEVKRKALEREEEYGLAAAAAANAEAEEGTVEVDGEMDEDVFSFDACEFALKGCGTGGYPKTLATDNDGDNLAPKHCFGRKWLYELVCEPTGTAKTAAGGSSTALADLSSKENAGPAKKKRRRVFTAAPKTSISVVGGGTANVTATTIGKGAADHRICIRCRHCRDDKDCLRPSSLSETHFYNLLVFWANNHYERCEAVPAAIQAKYDEAKAIKARGRKSYWISEAHAIGLRNIVDKDGKIGQGVAFAPAARGSE